jgi:hypothetical protein
MSEIFDQVVVPRRICLGLWHPKSQKSTATSLGAHLSDTALPEHLLANACESKVR